MQDRHVTGRYRGHGPLRRQNLRRDAARPHQRVAIAIMRKRPKSFPKHQERVLVPRQAHEGAIGKTIKQGLMPHLSAGAAFDPLPMKNPVHDWRAGRGPIDCLPP